MSEHHQEKCIVLLPSGPHFERLLREVLEIAIGNAGLVPSRLCWNPLSPTPIHLFVDEIERAEAVVADTSEHTEEIWLAVGCAVALGKPLCLISSAPEQANVPLGIQHLPHISYPIDAVPRDYIELQKKIYAQLSAIMPHLEKPYPEPSQQHPTPSTSTPAYPEDLASYEVMALTILELKGSNSGLSPRDLGLEMRACNAAPLTSHAMSALKRRRFIETKPVQIGAGNELYLSENLFLTRAGEDWLSRHGKRATPQRTPLRSRARFVSTR